MGQLKGLSIQGLEGDQPLCPLQNGCDPFISQPGLPFLAAKESMCSPLGTNCSTRGKFALFHSRTNGPRFNHVICHQQTIIGRRWGHYHIDESRSCLFHLPDSRKCVQLTTSMTTAELRPCMAIIAEISNAEINSHSFLNKSRPAALSPGTMMIYLLFYQGDADVDSFEIQCSSLLLSVVFPSALCCSLAC